MNITQKKYALYAIFVLSGIGGLIYESIWSHYLKLFLGHAAYAQSLVLIIFMGGMGLGAWLAARYSHRWKNLLLGYAVVELIIGLSALVFHSSFVGFTRFSYDTVLPAIANPMFAELYRWVGSALMILPQSILLGMTFPILSAGLIRLLPQTSGPVLATLYFTNSLGAAIGVLLSGFVLIAAVGLPGTILTAGVINIVVAVAVWLVCRSLPPGAIPPPVVVVAPVALAGNARRQLLIVAFLTGCASFIYEIIWIRMLSMVLGSSTHAFEIMLCAFILGLAFGSLCIKRYINTLTNPRFVLAAIQIVMGLLALGSLVLYNSSMDAMQWVMQALGRTDSAYTAFNFASMAITMAIMFPAAFCAGMTLPLITHALLKLGHGEQSIGSVYSANTFGSIIGVIVAIHIALPMMGIKGALMLGATIDIAAGLLLFWFIPRAQGLSTSRASRFGPAVALAAALLGLGLTWAFVHPDSIKMASGIYRFGRYIPPETAQILLNKDGKTATVHLISEQGILTLRTNGKTDASLQTGKGAPTEDEYTQTLIAALGLYHHPGAESVAMIGIGSGMTTHSLLASPRVKEVNTIEIEPFMIDGARLFGKASERAFTDSRSKIYVDDAKSFFAINPQRYDLIVSEPSNPWVSGVSSLFTREFYARIKPKLKPDGIFLQWLQIYQTDYDVVASVIKALGAEFGDYIIYETMAGDIAIVASATKVPEPSAALFSDPDAVRMLARYSVTAPADLEMRRIGDKRLLQPYFEGFATAENSDFFPILDLRGARDRFLGRNALAIGELPSYPIPVMDMLQSRTPGRATLGELQVVGGKSPRIKDAIVARQMADYVRDGSLAGKRDLNNQLVAELEHVRNYWAKCDASTAAVARLDPILRYAQFVNPGLPPEDLAGVWAQFTDSRCYAALSPYNRHWLTLFAAVGRRDAEGMESAVRTVLPMHMNSPVPAWGTAATAGYPHEIEYLHVALVTALLAQGKREEAKLAWQMVLAVNSERFKRTPMALLLDATVNGKMSSK